MNKNRLIEQIQQNKYRIDGGLTQEAFLFVSTITPLTNVDLFVVDHKKRVLLAWRDDEHCGTGWHIPGGIIRHKETMEERVQRTAINEFGCGVTDMSLIKVTEQILNQEERSHFISFLYECTLSEEFDVDIANQGLDEKKPGFLKWFDSCPSLVYSQYGYFDFINKWFKEKADNDK